MNILLISISRHAYILHFYGYKKSNRNGDSAVGIATGYGLGDRGVGVKSPGRVKNFLFYTSSTLAVGPTELPIQWVSRALSPGVKRPGREPDHSPPTNAKIKKTWIYTSTPSYVFMEQCLIN
jgi:hypothetical protein